VDLHLIKLWDVETGKELAKLGGQLMSFDHMAFSPDDRRLAGGGDDGSVTLWDIANPQPQEVGKLKGHKGQVWYVSFLPDGDTLVSFSPGDGMCVWRTPSFAEIDAVDKANSKDK
jgi:WD40 repeat protein